MPHEAMTPHVSATTLPEQTRYASGISRSSRTSPPSRDVSKAYRQQPRRVHGAMPLSTSLPQPGPKIMLDQ